MTFTADLWIEVAREKRSFTRETPFRSSEFNEDTSSLNEAKLLLKSLELLLIHEHVVNR